MSAFVRPARTGGFDLGGMFFAIEAEPTSGKLNKQAAEEACRSLWVWFREWVDQQKKGPHRGFIRNFDFYLAAIDGPKRRGTGSLSEKGGVDFLFKKKGGRALVFSFHDCGGVAANAHEAGAHMMEMLCSKQRRRARAICRDNGLTVRFVRPGKAWFVYARNRICKIVPKMEGDVFEWSGLPKRYEQHLSEPWLLGDPRPGKDEADFLTLPLVKWKQDERKQLLAAWKAKQCLCPACKE